jgi:hypothetical protein
MRVSNMISSITTTVSMIISSASVGSLLASLGVAAILTLIASLIIKELAVGEGPGIRLLGRNLDVAILPLLFVFGFIVSMKVWAIIA